MKDYNNNFGGGSRSGGGGSRGGNDRRGGGGFSRPSFGGGRGGNDRGGFRGGDREVTMHKTNCAECGGVAEVPFRPNGEKPVFCNDCFGDKKDAPSFGRNDRGDRGGSRDFSERKTSAPATDTRLQEQMDALHKKLDKIIKALDIKEPFETKDIFRAAKTEIKEKTPKYTPPTANALSQVVEKATAKKAVKAAPAKSEKKAPAAKKAVAKKAPVKATAKKAAKKKAPKKK